jgi:hypothetical protein
MKITRKQLRQIIKESMEQFQPRKQRSYHQISPMMKSMANAAKRMFAKDYPEINVKIDGRQGWIIVNGKKAVNISSADGQPMQIENMIDQMKQAYLGHETVQDKYSYDPAFLAYLTDEDYAEGDELPPSLPDGDRHPLDVDGDGKLTISEMKITRKQTKWNYKMNEKELRNLINEVTAEIIAESPINPGDGEFTEEEGLLLQQLSDDAVEEESLEDDDRKATHYSNHPENDEFMAWANKAASTMASEKIMKAEDIPVYGGDLNALDHFKQGTSSEEYARLANIRIDADETQAFLDKRFGPNAEGGPWTEEEDERWGGQFDLDESKEFTFDKFMKDVNNREDKIKQHKKELTENEGDANARLKQRLYQEDWRNSVKLKGNK